MISWETRCVVSNREAFSCSVMKRAFEEGVPVFHQTASHPFVVEILGGFSSAVAFQR